MLMVAYAIYVWFQMHTHHGLYDGLFENDEMIDEDRHKDLRKAKYVFTIFSPDSPFCQLVRLLEPRFCKSGLQRQQH
tara:strand:+ start:1882 stop:2112 length:231 start_codon:yes stop_codon:yes gene_type:complete